MTANTLPSAQQRSQSAPPLVESPQQRSERVALRRGLALLILTLVIPGSAQVIAGGRGLGRFALKVWLGVVTVLVAFVALGVANRSWAIALYANPFSQWLLAAFFLVGGLFWALLMLDAWRLSRPGSMGSPRKFWMSALAGVLTVALAVGSVQASAAARAQAGLFGSLFAGGGDRVAEDGRINIMLIGADAEPDRPGIRTDAVMVASINEKTGRTVLFSLPRNLQRTPFPKSSPLRALYPDGYVCAEEACLLNAIHSEGEKHADLYPGEDDPGMQATREAVSETLGLKINYYAMVDMTGFEALIDSLGGIRLDIARAVPIGGGSSRVEGYIQPGQNVRLDGYQAMWFARSRAGSSDYDRMARQKCVINAMAKQLTPATVLTRFNEIAAAGGSVLSSDIPGGQIGTLLDLANQARALPLASATFTPPLITPAHPDFELIRTTVEESIARSVELDKQAEAEAKAAAEAAAAASTAPAPPAAQEPAAAEEEPGTDAVVASTKPKDVPTDDTQRQTDDLSEICSVAG